MPALGTSNAPQAVKHAPDAVAPPPKPSVAASVSHAVSSTANAVSTAVSPAPAATAAAATTRAAASAVSAAASVQHAVKSVTKPAPLLNAITSLLPSLNPAERIFAPAAVKAGARYNVSPALLMGVIKQETGFDPSYKGPSTTEGSARGSTGFLPSSAAKHGVEFGTSPRAIQSQVAGAAKYLAELDVNNDPKGALKQFGMGRDSKPVVKAAREYGPLDRLAIKAASRFSADPDHATAPDHKGSPLARAVGQAAQGVGNTADPRPQNTERSGIGATAQRIANTVTPGPQNTERPMAQRYPAPDGNPVKFAQQTQIPSTPRQAARQAQAAVGQSVDLLTGPSTHQIVKKLVKTAKTASGGKFLDGTLNPDQQAFARSLSKEAGLSLPFAAAAVLREGGNLTPGDNNWLNIGAFDSGFDGGIMGDPRFSDPVEAGRLTAEFLKGNEFGASSGIQNIYAVAQAGGSDQEVGQAWADSGWASSGASPLDTLGQVPIKVVPEKKLSPAFVKQAEQEIGKAATKALLAGGEIVKAPKQGGDNGIAVKGLLKSVVNTEGDAAQAAQLGVKDGTLSIRALIPPMQEALVALAKKSGQPVQVNEGFRTAQRQIDLANGEGGATGPAAAPGTSNHEFGFAADLQLTAEQTALLPEVGLSNTVVAGEPWHVELVDGTTRPDTPPDPSDLGVAPQGVKIKGTGLMVVQPAPTTTTSTTGTTTTGTAAAPTTTTSGAPLAPADQAAIKKTAKASQQMASGVALNTLPFAARAVMPSTYDPRSQANEDPLLKAFSRFRPNA